MTKIPPLYILISAEQYAQFALDVEEYTVTPLFSTEGHAVEFRDVYGASEDYTPVGFDDDKKLIEVLEKFSDRFDAYAIDPPTDRDKPIANVYTFDDTRDILREKSNPEPT